MLKVKCVYCGQKILADDDKMGKKAHCPKCNHLILINEAALIKKGEKDLSDDEIDRLLKSSKAKSDKFGGGMDYPEREKRLLRKWFAPDFDDLTLFLMFMAAILVGGTNDILGEKLIIFFEAIFKIEASRNSIFLIGIFTFVLFGLAYLPVYYVFSKRPKNEVEKAVMLFFAVLFTAGSGYIAGKAMLKDAGYQGGTSSFDNGWYLFPFFGVLNELKLKAVFPLWNILNGLWMFWLYQAGVINTESIVERDATLWEVLLGLGVLLVVYFICQFGLNLHWAMTYSICIVYSTSFAKWGKK